MHVKLLLDLATELLGEVLTFRHSADSVVSAFFRQHRSLGPRERRTLAETTYAVLRERSLLAHLAQSGSGSLERRLAIAGWQGDAETLGSALSETERGWKQRIDALDRSAMPPELRHNLPKWLADALEQQLGRQFWPLVAALNRSAPLDLRVNALKAKRDAVAARLAQSGIEARPTPYSPLGLRIDGKPALQRLDVFRSGEIEVQDEGSQLIALALDAKRGEMVVDFCAGAGGKTLALGAAMRNTGRLYAFDTSGHRLTALEPRLARSGLSNVHPVQTAHERDDRIGRLAGKIDRVLVDAPCSGLGTLRRNPDLKWRQNEQTVRALQVQQLQILSSAAQLLKAGGRLVYATCSLLECENTRIVGEFTSGHSGQFEELPMLGVLGAAHVAKPEELTEGKYLRLWPHRHNTDGFFAAAWTRT